MKTKLPYRLDFNMRFRGHPLRTVLFVFFAIAFSFLGLLSAFSSRGISPGVLFWTVLALCAFAPVLVTPENQRLEAILYRKVRASRRPKRLVKFGLQPPVETPTATPTVEPENPAPVEPLAAPGEVDDVRFPRPLALGAITVLVLITLAASSHQFVAVITQAADNARQLLEMA